MVLISIGAVLLNLRVAAASLGYDVAVGVDPDPGRTLVAELTVALMPGAGDHSLAGLFPALGRRRTNRQPFDDRTVPADTRRALTAAAETEGVNFEWVMDPGRHRWLLTLIGDANLQDVTDRQRSAERHRWVGGYRDRDGVPSASLGPRPLRLSAPVRDLAAGTYEPDREATRFEEHPELAVLSTRRDSPTEWVTAGQALQRVLLVATSQGLAASMLTQVIEHVDTRWLVRDPLGGWSEPQVVLRFGYGPEVPPTPRRLASQFIVSDVHAPEG
jgi:hypothetical protein